MKTILRTLLTSLTVLALLGCAGQPLKIANVMPPQGIDMTQGRTITARAGGFQLLLFFPIMTNNRQARAYHALLGQSADGFLTDVKVTESWTYAFVGTVYTTSMSATVYPKAVK